jgi:hypothetical protein
MYYSLKVKWHHFWIRFNELLLEGCLCEEEKNRIMNKIVSHKGKTYVA